MKNYRKDFKGHTNPYFDTYYLRDENGFTIGIIEHHCRQVKTAYYVGWKLEKNKYPLQGKTETFEIEEEAINYSLSE